MIILGCVTALGMENDVIDDKQIDASSQLDSTHSARQGRLHSKADGSTWGSWSARTNDLNQWLQVDLSTYTRVTRVATQGRNGFYQWVTKYKLQYSDDENTFHVYEEQGNGGAKVYRYYRLRIFIIKEITLETPTKMTSCMLFLLVVFSSNCWLFVYFLQGVHWKSGP